MGLGTDILTGGASELLDNGDSGGGPSGPQNPRKLANMTPEQIQTELANVRTLQNRNAAMGRTGGRWLGRRESRLLGYLPDGVDESTITGVDFNDPNFQLSDLAGAKGLRDRHFGNHAQPGVWKTQNQQLLTEATTNAVNQDYEQNTKPGLDSAQGIAQGLADTPAFGADYIQQARSQISSTIKGIESERLRRVGAVLGLRGLDASSPAGAALANRAALDADAELSKALTQFSNDTQLGNRNAAASAASLLSSLSLTRQSAERANKMGNLEALSDINRELAGIQQAVRQQSELRAYQADLSRQANSRDWLGTGLNFVTDLVGAFMGGGGGNTPTKSGQAPLSSYGTPNSYGQYSPTGGWQGVGQYQSPASPYQGISLTGF